MCCSVLQSVAACCRVLQSVAECCSVLQRVAVFYSLLQCVAVLLLTCCFFLGYHVPGPLTRSWVLKFKTIGGVGWRWVTWVNLWNPLWLKITQSSVILYTNIRIVFWYSVCIQLSDTHSQSCICQIFSCMEHFGYLGTLNAHTHTHAHANTHTRKHTHTHLHAHVHVHT